MKGKAKMNCKISVGGIEFDGEMQINHDIEVPEGGLNAPDSLTISGTLTKESHEQLEHFIVEKVALPLKA
ncbi:MAG TPA: hypothetical protein VF648_07075 [Pyrinomonadaceae bacterium]|jgi:hypothetical protein